MEVQEGRTVAKKETSILCGMIGKRSELLMSLGSGIAIKLFEGVGALRWIMRSRKTSDA